MRSEDARNKFLKQILADLEAGHVLPVEHYQGQFPEQAAAIAREYEEVVHPGRAGADSAGPESTSDTSGAPIRLGGDSSSEVLRRLAERHHWYSTLEES